MNKVILPQLLGRTYRLNTNLLPFEQWDVKNRFNPGFTRPRGKRYANAIKLYNNDAWKKPDSDGATRWLRAINTASVSAKRASADMRLFGKVACNMSVGYRIHDEVDDFPDLPGELNDLEHFQSGRVTDVTLTAIPNRVGKDSHIEEMIEQRFKRVMHRMVTNSVFGARCINETDVESQRDTSLTPDQIRKSHHAFISDPWVNAVRNVQLEAYQNSHKVQMVFDAEAFGMSDMIVKPFGTHDFAVSRRDLINNDFAPDMTIRNKPHRFDTMTTDDIIRDMESSRIDLALMYPTDHTCCKTCGGFMIGDGYKNVLHCEFVDLGNEVYEPDSNPIYCNGDDNDDTQKSEAI